MPGTSRTKPTKPIYDAPSRLSQGLVAGLSVAVVMMAGWFVATVSQRAATTVKADAGAAANPRTPAPAAGPATGEPPASVHFDWPAFTAQPAPSSPRTALPQAPEISPGGDPARATWRPATPAPDGRDRGAPFPAAAVPTGTAPVVSPPSAAGRRDVAAAAPPPRQASRRQKMRVDADAGQ